MTAKWCRFQIDGKVFFGKIDGDEVAALDAAPWDGGKQTPARYPLSQVKLLVPVIPPTFYCVGLNYREHILASAKRRGIEPKFPQRPDVNSRANNALCAHGDATTGLLHKFHAHAVRLGRVHHFARDLGGQRLGEHGAVTEAPQVELQALRLDAVCIGHVLDGQAGDVGLVRDRAHRHQFVRLERNFGDVSRCGEHLDMLDGVLHSLAENRES